MKQILFIVLVLMGSVGYGQDESITHKTEIDPEVGDTLFKNHVDSLEKAVKMADLPWFDDQRGYSESKMYHLGRVFKLYVTYGKGKMQYIYLTELIGGEYTYEVLFDKLSLEVRRGELIDGDVCVMAGEPDRQIITLYDTKNNETKKAWSIDTDNNQLSELDVTTVKCL